MSKFAKKAAVAENAKEAVKPVKAAKLVKDKAPKAEKKAKAPKAERVSKSDDRKLIVHTKVNPHREGSNRYKAYEIAKSSKKVADYMENGGKGKYLARWEKAGLIELA